MAKLTFFLLNNLETGLQGIQEDLIIQCNSLLFNLKGKVHIYVVCDLLSFVSEYQGYPEYHDRHSLSHYHEMVHGSWYAPVGTELSVTGISKWGVSH